MYKQLLDKGFKPTYYTDANLFEATSLKNRLCYNYKLDNKELIKVVINVLGIYDTYFNVTNFEHENYNDIFCTIEVTEDLSSFWLYIYNADVENYEITKDQMQTLLNVLPNEFILESADY